MSPLWRDEVGIFLGPTRIVLARMRRGIRPRCVAEQGVSVESKHCGDWTAAMDVLRQQADNRLWQQANVRVVVSDHWTRYAILPWAAELSGDAERLDYARIILSNTYGEVSDDWSVQVSAAPPRATAIVSAVPRQLIDDIGDTLASNQLKLVSLQPHLMVAFNSWRDKIASGAAWFASIDEGSLAALHVTDGKCDRVRSVRISGDWTVEMRRMQTMGRLARSRPTEGPVFVDAPAWLRESTQCPDESLEWLEEKRDPENIAEKVSLLKRMYA